ncbi:MAG: hypothetical protein ABI614_29530, partial [Planctomycetota bacterium]
MAHIAGRRRKTELVEVALWLHFTDPEFTSTHSVSQTWTDDEHWRVSESTLVGYNITRESTDADGGAQTVTRSGRNNVTFVASQG